MTKDYDVQDTECPCCHAELEIHLGNGLIVATIATEGCDKECNHNWIPYVSDVFFSKCSKCGQIKNDQ